MPLTTVLMKFFQIPQNEIQADWNFLFRVATMKRNLTKFRGQYKAQFYRLSEILLLCIQWWLKYSYSTYHQSTVVCEQRIPCFQKISSLTADFCERNRDEHRETQVIRPEEKSRLYAKMEADQCYIYDMPISDELTKSKNTWMEKNFC